MKIAALMLIPLWGLCCVAEEDLYRSTARNLLAEMMAFETTAETGQVPELAGALSTFFLNNGFSEDNVYYFPSIDGKSGSLTIRFPGESSDAKPIMLMAHMDVVGANKTDWNYEPYKLTEDDGFLYGRGVMDNKGAIAVMATALAKLNRAGYTPAADIYFLITGDEETTAQTTRDVFDHLPILKTAKFALNGDAGLGVLNKNREAVYYQLNTAEKTYATFFATVTNPGGHSSLPRADHAIYELAEALTRLRRYEFPVRTNATTVEYFRNTAQFSPAPLSEYKRRFADDEKDAEAVNYLNSLPEERSIMGTTCTATMLSAGHAENALPREATATINCRIFPGVGIDEIKTRLEEALDNPSIEVRPSFRPGPNPASKIDPQILSAVKKAVHQTYPGLPVVPYMTASSTDSAITRSAGIPTYGTGSFFFVFPGGKRSHGKDERLPLGTFYDGIAYWETLIKETTSARP